MSDIIKLPRPPLTGKMTFIAPLYDCGPDFRERLYCAVAAMFHCWDMKIDELIFTNFTNEDGDQIIMYSIDITDWSGPERNWLDREVEESNPQHGAVE